MSSYILNDLPGGSPDRPFSRHLKDEGGEGSRGYLHTPTQNTKGLMYHGHFSFLAANRSSCAPDS